MHAVSSLTTCCAEILPEMALYFSSETIPLSLHLRRHTILIIYLTYRDSTISQVLHHPLCKDPPFSESHRPSEIHRPSETFLLDLTLPSMSLLETTLTTSAVRSFLQLQQQ